MNLNRKYIWQFATAIITVLIGGNIAPIGYVIGVAFSMIGFMILKNVTQTDHIILSASLCLLGLVIIFFRIRKDAIEIRNETK